MTERTEHFTRLPRAGSAAPEAPALPRAASAAPEAPAPHSLRDWLISALTLRQSRRELARQRRRQVRQINASTGNRRNVPAAVLALAMLAVELVVAAESFRGLVGFAHLIGIYGVSAAGVPVTLDGVAIVAALLALRAELAAESSGLYRLTLIWFTLASAAANAWHGERADSIESALYLGLMSVAVAWLFNLTLRQIRIADRRKARLVTERLPHFSGWHWARYPGRTFGAWSLAIRDGHETARAALDAADAAELPALGLDTETLTGLSARDRLAVAFGAVGAVDVPRALAVLAERGAPVDQSHAYQVRRQIMTPAGGDQA
ncbi:MAG: DUF2637 domain-containing protein [Streptosporangiaceae bacterium]